MIELVIIAVGALLAALILNLHYVRYEIQIGDRKIVKSWFGFGHHPFKYEIESLSGDSAKDFAETTFGDRT